MPTRLTKPSIVKKLGVTAVLVCFQIYLGYSVVSGQYGVLSKDQIKMDIGDLQEQSAKLQAEIDAYSLKIALFDPKKLDPDILTEKARELLSMAHRDDRIVILPKHGSEL